MTPSLVRSQIGSLTVATVQASNATPSLVVMLCHGFGAPGDDLVPVAMEILAARPKIAEKVRFIFPEAPLSLDQVGMFGGRAWWMIDMARLLSLQDGDAGPEVEARLIEDVPEGLAPARQAQMKVIDEVSRATKLPIGRFVLGGFSQGAMITTDLTLRLEEAPAGLGIFSGTLICASEWKKRAPTRRGLRVFQAHGRQDPLLPFPIAEQLRDLLTGAGLSVDFLPFTGGHTISMSAIEKFSDLIEAAL